MFLANKTGIDVREAAVCASSVEDNDDCRPQDFGNGEWQRNPSFPPYTISETSDRIDNIDTLMGLVRLHYLGSPYYADDVHAFCKHGLSPDVIPAEGTSLQDYQLAKVIEDRAVKSLAGKLRSELDGKDADDARAITTRFQEGLMREVNDRVQARLLWFVSRYPGGVQDIQRNDALRKCMQEHQDNSGSQVVTGVAGYVVLDNRIDTAVSAESTVYRALDAALSGHEDISLGSEFRESLGAEWKQKVEQVAQIKIARQDMSVEAWPLWVQFQE